MPRLTNPTLLRSDTVHARLLLRVRNLPAGEAVPSVRSLMRTYDASQATIDRALGRLKADGYIESRPGIGSFAMGKRHRGTVGLLLSEDLGALDLQVLKQARRTLGDAGYEVQLTTFPRDDALAAIRDLRCDALVVLPSSRPRVLEDLHAARPSSTPTVLLDLIPEDLDLNAVATDNAHGGALAARHLVGLGHRRLALILSEPDVESRRARIAGFMRAARRARATVETIDCLGMAERAGVPIDGGTYAVARTGIARVLRERRRLGFTAAFADSDLGALGAMKAMHEAGIAMPGAVSVIGFDDLPEGRCFHPALTTIRQDLAGWFAEVARIVEARLAGDRSPAERVRVRPTLVIRESTGAAPT